MEFRRRSNGCDSADADQAVNSSASREYLLDVSRLIWRVWRGAIATGIDRVCLEYLDHFGPRSQAVVQYKGRTFVLSPADSDRLFSILRDPGPSGRMAISTIAPLAWARARRTPPRRRMPYLNVGHTGLHDNALPAWIASNDVRAFYLVHDLIPITHPRFCRPDEEHKHELRMVNVLTSAAGIVTNSQATLAELAAFASERGLQCPPSKAIWIAGQRPLANVGSRRFERPHFVTIGTIEGRKNHLLLLKVWRRLAAEMGENAPILFVIGQRGWEADETFALLDASDLKPHIVELGQSSDAELAAITAGARALLMPSLAEGFGLPVIEALQLGTPVIAGDLAVYREIVGSIPTYIDQNDELAWDAAIRAFLTDGGERERQLRAIADYSAPDWPGHFVKLEAWLETMVR